MREIKYRFVFKHKKDGDYYFEHWTLDEVLFGVGERKQDVRELIAALRKDGYELVDQNRFSALRDKNGREIYEKDILKWKCSKSGDETVRDYTTTLEWGDIPCGYRIVIHDKGEKWATNRSWWNDDDREVIGNIYDDPTLLK